VNDHNSAFDTRAFRNALGAFATGVTVVTTRSSAGEQIGLTASSFNSVSLKPPLVLWSLARDAQSFPTFSQATHWAVHVLAADQEHLSRRFANRGTDKFAGLDVTCGLGQVPLLIGCKARFQCRTTFQYDGGDHVIFVGEVLDFTLSDTPPLVFHGGRYAMALERGVHHEARELTLAGDSGSDFLGYLLGRAHALFHRQIRPLLIDDKLSGDEHLVLASISTNELRTESELIETIGDLLDGELHSALDKLHARSYVERVECAGKERLAGYRLSPVARNRAVTLISAYKSFEAEIIELFGESDGAALKALLRKLLTVANERNPKSKQAG
jgi:3-hydroxy-9,10-secoandrosta-1,3,5(10)-triene-9,17-dione monooxygenase reductase component